MSHRELKLTIAELRLLNPDQVDDRLMDAGFDLSKLITKMDDEHGPGSYCVIYTQSIPESKLMTVYRAQVYPVASIEQRKVTKFTNNYVFFEDGTREYRHEPYRAYPATYAEAKTYIIQQLKMRIAEAEGAIKDFQAKIARITDWEE